MKLVGWLAVVALSGCASRGQAKDRMAEPSPAADPVPARGVVPTLAPNAPEDQIKSVDSAREAKLAELTAQARATFADAKARFLQGLPQGEVFFVATTLTDGPLRESAFVAVRQIEGTRITGVLATEFAQIHNHRPGEVYTMDEADLLDWLISKPDGSEEGNVVGKYLDTQP